MEYFAETSFLCALYCEQDNSVDASTFAGRLGSGLTLSGLVKFEFENGLSLQAGRFHRDRTQGIAPRQRQEARRAFHEDLTSGFWKIRAMELAEILRVAEELSERHTEEELNRAMDILHVATAVHWGAKKFLTFDARQARLAKAAGLKAPLKTM